MKKFNNTIWNNTVNEMIDTALGYQSRNELLHFKLAHIWLTKKDEEAREIAEAIIDKMIENNAVNLDGNFIIPDDTFISALTGYLMPVPSATKALAAIRRALEEADVLGYYQTDLDIIADALQDK